ncbi:Nicotinate/nicotinamide mononucleotide adenyltransferase [Klebsormidium nitens]|uniref:Nicotinamide-nucleotide adenylyltransferase n=1 Tax=Klebsormidium nitens TaxID=105231 RepID=A0A1Y1HJP8_KLENI|nr:Nicotinate/nicotinamide mononucleotide adenyltransferase [Klebsormidium nitens]|eukprot:GAQ77772.1 Nicotinate/nicotinamide mononucleotide adenyltransferase [Klebsormidium nitens]
MASDESQQPGEGAGVSVPLPLDKLCFTHSQEGQPIVLVSTGSFNPPTILHLRMFELARDDLTADGYSVLGGYMSPVNDAYGKKGLLPAHHRIAMCRLAAADSDLLMVDPWEALQADFQRSIKVLKRIQQGVNAARPEGMPPVRLMLVCGADLLESFSRPGVWIEAQLREIFADHGVVCISRGGSDARRHIHENDLLFEYRKSIRIVDEWASNEVSSTLVRRFLSRGLSVKYLTPDSVIQYVKEHKLYTPSHSKPMDENGAGLSSRTSTKDNAVERKAEAALILTP